MKKFYLIFLLCLLLPCSGFAQAPESAFSIDGTVWHSRLFVLTVVFSIPPNYAWQVEEMRYGIYNGEIYWCNNDPEIELCTPRPIGEYYPKIVIDSPVISLAYVRFLGGGKGYQLACMLTTAGLGYFTSYGFGTTGGFFLNLYRFGIMIKVADNWNPEQP